MIDARTRMLSSVYARHSDRMSAGIALRAKGLPGGYPLLSGAGIATARNVPTATGQATTVAQALLAAARFNEGRKVHQTLAPSR